MARALWRHVDSNSVLIIRKPNYYVNALNAIKLLLWKYYKMWNPKYDVYILRIEGTQKGPYLCKVNQPYLSYNLDIYKEYYIPPFELRHEIAAISYLIKLP